MRDYIIAGHRVRLTGESIDKLIFAGLTVFETETTADAQSTTDTTTSQVPILILETDCIINIGQGREVEKLDTFDFPDANADCHLYKYNDGYLFNMISRSTKEVVTYQTTTGSTIVKSNITAENDTMLLRFGLWMTLGLALSPLNAIAIHASVICCNGKCVLFLGESGTGKSTHTRLWRENIEGAKLLNDDSPIIAIVDGVPTAFGSPWSGKTPCYKNEHYPISAIVRLSQAPHNKMFRLPTIMALGALLPSCPPSFAFDEILQDNICNTLSEIIAKVPVYHLECLPNSAAAKLSYQTIFEI